MDMIFKDAKDKNVAKVIIYVASNKAYVDAAHKTQMTTSQLKDAFLKGAVLEIENGYAIPLFYTETAKVGTVSGVSAMTASANTLVTAAAKAD